MLLPETTFTKEDYYIKIHNNMVLHLVAILNTILATILAVIALFQRTISNRGSKPSKIVPVSVNFHFTRKCNYECGFCFHTEKTSHVEPFENMQRGL